MDINLKNLGEMGFTACHPLAGKTSITLLYKKAGNRVVFASGYSPQMVGFFELTEQELADFEKGKLSLVPPGFCSPTNRNIKEDCQIVLDRSPKSKKEMLAIIEKIL